MPRASTRAMLPSGGYSAATESAASGTTFTVPTVSLERALADDKDGALALDADDGRYTVPLRRVVYVKRFTREARLGFSSG